jgi:prepilin-type N-terminal cleavage/methylation domain-containing protein
VEQEKMLTFQAGTLRRINGFTLLELILVVLLMSILLTFASVRWGFYAKKDKETFLERLSIEISLLRENAVSDYQQKAIQFDITKNMLSIGYVDLIKGFVSSRDIIIPEKYLLKDVIINGGKISIGKGVMRFYPTGLVDRLIMHIEGKDEGFYSLTVNPLTAKISGEHGYIEEIIIPKRGNPT